MEGSKTPDCAQEQASFLLRPHHGMCLAYFEGYGYGDVFTKHMGQLLEIFLNEPVSVRLCVSPDVICEACPNRRGQADGCFWCRAEEKVAPYDRAVLAACGLKNGSRISFQAFSQLVQERVILTGARIGICGSCIWNEICSTGRSRWEKARPNRKF